MLTMKARTPQVGLLDAVAVLATDPAKLPLFYWKAACPLTTTTGREAAEIL